MPYRAIRDISQMNMNEDLENLNHNEIENNKRIIFYS